MGNQIVCPSGQSWYLDDLNTMGMKIQRSIFDGTFMLSFVTADARTGQQYVVKIIQINDKKYRSLAEDFLKMFARMKHTSPEILSGNVFPTPYLTRSGAYMIREYLDMSLCDRMVSYPVLEHSEKMWISFQLLRIVKNLHAEGFRHGDIKPENVFLSPRGFVSLVDHAPFKPLVIGRNQPHYFVHFFSYGRGSCFLAPERFIAGPKRPKINEFALDWFSIGCVMAYIFTNGKCLFDFTSIIQYADGDNRSLQVLDEIEDPRIREFITMLIDRDPLKRIEAADTMPVYFPEWFGMYFDFNVFNGLDSRPVDSICTLHKQIVSIIGDGTGDYWVIYLQTIGEALMKPNTIDAELQLLRSYGEIALRIENVSVKITRIIPRLVSLLDNKSSVVSVYAFGYMVDVLRTIDEVPEVFSDVGKLFLLPRIAASLQKNENWSFWFASELPNVIQELTRVWPDLSNIFPKTPQFFMPLMAMFPGDKEKDARRRMIVRSFMHSAKQVIPNSPYSVVRALCFVVLQLSNTHSSLPVVADFVAFCVRNMVHNNFVTFRAEFSSGFQNVLFGFMGNEKYYVSCAMRAFLAILSREKRTPPLYSKLFKVVMNSLDYDDPEIAYLSRRMIDSLPVTYQKMAAAAILHRKSKKQEEAANEQPAPVEEPQEQNDDAEPVAEEEETEHESNEESSEEPKSEEIEIVPPQPPTQPTCFVVEYKAFSQEIKNIIARPNAIFAAAGGTIVQMSFDWKAEHKVRTRLEYRSSVFNGLKSVDFCDKSFIAATYDRGIEILSCSRFERRGVLDTGLKIRQTTVFNRQAVCISFENAGSTVHVMNLENMKKVTSFPVREVVKYMSPPMNGFLLPVITNSNRLIFIDTRVGLCVAEQTARETVFQLYPYYGTKYIAKTESGFYYYDIANPVSPFFSVYGRADFTMISNPDNKGPGLMLCDQSGTFFIRDHAKSYSLFDGSVVTELPHIDNSVTLPRVIPMSLHGHTFPVSAGCTLPNCCLTGDISGYVHIWSPTLSKWQV